MLMMSSLKCETSSYLKLYHPSASVGLSSRQHGVIWILWLLNRCLYQTEKFVTIWETGIVLTHWLFISLNGLVTVTQFVRRLTTHNNKRCSRPTMCLFSRCSSIVSMCACRVVNSELTYSVLGLGSTDFVKDRQWCMDKYTAQYCWVQCPLLQYEVFTSGACDRQSRNTDTAFLYIRCRKTTRF